MISAPLLYEDMVTVTDVMPPGSVDGFVSRRDVPENKPAWWPVVWGPSYATGISFSGGMGDFDFTLEAKNASVSSRPAVWDAIDTGWDTDPIWTGRVVWHPLPEVTVGVAHTTGPYLRARAERSIAASDSVNDFDQSVTAIDFTWERRQLQIWIEIMRAGFEVPRVGDVEMTGEFAEVRWKFAPQWWLAARWNRSVFDEVPSRWQALVKQRFRWDGDNSVRHYVRKHNGLANITWKNFRFSNFLAFWDAVTIHLFCSLGALVAIVLWPLIQTQVPWSFAALTIYSAAVLSELPALMAIVYYSRLRRVDLLLGLAIPIMPLYRLALIVVRVCANLCEIFWRTSYRMGHVPPHVREATWCW